MVYGCDLCPPKAYTEELVDLHQRLMALTERNILQQVRNQLYLQFFFPDRKLLLRKFIIQVYRRWL